MKKKLLVILFIITGCSTTPHKKATTAVPPIHAEIDEVKPLFDEEILDEKIKYFKIILTDSMITKKDKEIAQKRIKLYKNLKNVSEKDLSKSELRKLLHTLLSETQTLDIQYFNSKKTPQKHLLPTISLYIEKRKMILDRYFSNDYESVKENYFEMKNLFGLDSLTTELRLIYTLSIAKTGMIDEAISMGEKIINDIQLTPNAILLISKLAEWHLNQGNIDKAISISERLTDLSDEQQWVIDTVSRKINQAYIKIEEEENKKDDREPPLNETHDPHVTTLIPKADDTTTEPAGEIDLLLFKVDTLVSENKFEEAHTVLIEKNEDNLGDADRELITQALKSLEEAQRQYKENNVTVLPLLKEEEITPVKEEEITPFPEDNFIQEGLENEPVIETSDGLSVVLNKSDALINEKKFDQAHTVLIEKKEEELTDREQEIIDEAIKNIEAAREEYKENQILKLIIDKESIFQAKKFFEEEKFLEVLTTLNELDPALKETSEVIFLKEKAEKKFITVERNRAAKLYLAAKKAEDPQSKKAYLNNSSTVLTTLVDRFPHSSLIEKIKSNLDIVNTELNKLVPMDD